jgi:S1-C subfamily serine protease
MLTNRYHSKVVKIITQSLNIDIQQPFKLHSSSSGICTGFFISPKHIITCSHCIINSKDIFFEIPSKGEKKYKLNLIGVCNEFDIALLESDEYSSRYHFKLGSIKDIKAGNEVYAVGFPLGQSNLKVTKGIISGIQFHSIQTDAPINAGNSGGPLVYKGKVIGINKSKITHSSNIGYATPISNFHIIEKELYDKKKLLIKRPEYGFTTNNSSNNMLRLKNVKREGVYICDIFKNSPISKTNIHEGDILTKINNYNIDNYGLIESIFTKDDKIPFMGVFDGIKIGSNVVIEYSHDGKMYKKSFKYDYFELPIKYIYPQFEQIQYEILGGVVFMDFYLNHLDIINPKTEKLPITLLRHYDSDKRTSPKIIISYIFPNTEVSNLNILDEGDFIKKVNNIEVSTISNFRKALIKIIIFKNKKYIKIDTEDNKEIILNVKDVINKEQNISETFKFKSTKSYHNMTKHE